MTNVTATGSDGSGNNFGVYNSSSSPTMTNVTATASGGTTNYGVRNHASSPTMTSVIVTASGGEESYGVYNVFSSSPTMTNCISSGRRYFLAACKTSSFETSRILSTYDADRS